VKKDKSNRSDRYQWVTIQGEFTSKKMIQWMSSTEMPGRECEKMMRSCTVRGAKASGVVISSATQ
jgi:hypothetical protein